MTVQTNTTVATGIGNGVTSVFPIPFKFNRAEDLYAILIDSETQEFQELTLDSDYTVSGVGREEGGAVTTTIPVPAGKIIKVFRIIDLLQKTDLRNQGKFFAEIHEDLFDRIVMMVQQLQEQLDRAVKVPPNSSTPADELYAEFKQDVADAEAAARESEVARDESRDIAEKFGDVDGAVTAAEQARDAAGAHAWSAGLNAGRSEVAADRSESARDAAFVNADVFPDVASGLAAVADGEQFQVLSADGENYTRYRKDSDTVATEVGAGFPTPSAVRGKLPIENSENIFNPEAAMVDVNLSASGALEPLTGYFTSDAIRVEPGETYTHSDGKTVNARKCFYDSSRAFLSTFLSTEQFTVPAGAAFVRISIREEAVPVEQFVLVKGVAVPAQHEPWVGLMAERIGSKNRPHGYAGLDGQRKLPLGSTAFFDTVNLFNPEDPEIEDGVFYGSNGQATDGFDFFTTGFIPVSFGDRVSWTAGSNKFVSFWDSNKVFVSAILANRTVTVNVSGAAFIRVSPRYSETPVDEFMLIKGGVEDIPETYLPYGATSPENIANKNQPGGYAGLDDKGKLPLGSTAFFDAINIFDPADVEEGVYYHPVNGRVEAPGFFTTGFIPVTPGDQVSWSNVGINKYISFWDAGMVFISASLAMGTATVELPTAAFIRVSPRHSETPVESFMLIKGSLDKLPPSFVPMGVSSPENTANKNKPGGYVGLGENGLILPQFIPGSDETPPWAGKKIVAIGDSITYGFIPRNAPGYPGKLQSYLPLVAQELGATFVNYGISGSTLGDNGTGARQPFTKRYSSMDGDADLVIVMGGTNDFRNNVPVGTMDDRTDLTFYGALHVLCEGLIAKYYNDQTTEVGKNKQIMFMTPLKILDPVTGGLDHAIDPYVEAVKEVCKYYAIPVLDLHNVSGITPHILRTVQGTEPGYTGMYNPYITDGTHPTQEGHEKIARVVAGFIKSLS